MKGRLPRAFLLVGVLVLLIALCASVSYSAPTGEDSTADDSRLTVADIAGGDPTNGAESLEASVGDSTVVYTYDDLGRLVKVQYPNGATLNYTYDPVGNRLSYTTVSELIPLRSGWNWISFTVNNCYYDTASPPSVPLLADADLVPLASIGEAFSSIAGKYELVRSFDEAGGHTFDPVGFGVEVPGEYKGIIRLEPDVESAYQYPEIKTIWGGAVEFPFSFEVRKEGSEG